MVLGSHLQVSIQIGVDTITVEEFFGDGVTQIPILLLANVADVLKLLVTSFFIEELATYFNTANRFTNQPVNAIRLTNSVLQVVQEDGGVDRYGQNNDLLLIWGYKENRTHNDLKEPLWVRLRKNIN